MDYASPYLLFLLGAFACSVSVLIAVLVYEFLPNRGQRR